MPHPVVALVACLKSAAKHLRMYSAARGDADSFSFAERERFRVDAAEKTAELLRILPAEKQAEVVGWLLRDDVGRVADLLDEAAREVVNRHRDWTIEDTR